MTDLLPAVLLASFLGSPHCAGMCGGFVAFYAGSDPGRGVRVLPSHIAYHFGRLTTYALLGAFLGAFGAAVDTGGRLAGVRQAAAFGAGALLVAWGGWTLLTALRVRLPLPELPGAVRRVATRAHARLGERPPLVRALLLGLLSTLLPCGWLWAFAILAVGTGSAVAGAIVMAAFWAGTVPALAGIGAGVGVLAGPFRRHLPVVSALILIAVGMLSLAGRLGAETPTVADSKAPASIEESLLRTGALGADADPPCPRHAPR